MKNRWVYFILGLGVLLLSGCSGGSVTSGGGSGGSSFKPEGTEETYNATPISYSGDTITVTATAQYARLQDENTGGGIGAVATHPIRFAEYHVYNSAGTLIQAGETGSGGEISAIIPRTVGSYTLSIHSRGFNNQVRSSVLDNPYDKKFYRQVQAFEIQSGDTTPKALGTITAPQDGDMQGAAFHLLDMVVLSNDFLRARVPTASDNSSSCASGICSATFTVAPKSQVYWTKGLSPGTYLDAPSQAISFYVPVSSGGLYEGIYILGGIQGSICTDNDHFDRAIIVHEYGHFLESALSKSDSPGGSHNGNSVIDPRLAWSEGFANFLQAVVLGRVNYVDTVRLGCASPVYQININIETMTTNQDSVVSAADGEGNFREISISRALFDAMTGPDQFNTTNTDSTVGNLGFSIIWNAFIKLGQSTFQSSSGAIVGRSVGHFNRILQSQLTAGAAPGNTWASVLTLEKQRTDLRDYGHQITPGACTTDLGGNPWAFTQTGPNADTSASGTTYSNMFTNHRFLLFYYDGSTANSIIRLRYKRQDLTTAPWLGSPVPWDLDLYLYRSNYVFLRSTDIVRFSERDYPENTTNTSVWPGFEEINLTGLAAGYYFVNVRVYYPTASFSRGRTTDFILENSAGTALCFNSSF